MLARSFTRGPAGVMFALAGDHNILCSTSRGFTKAWVAAQYGGMGIPGQSQAARSAREALKSFRAAAGMRADVAQSKAQEADRTSMKPRHGRRQDQQANQQAEGTRMSTVRAENVARMMMEIPLQPASYDIWDKKYRLKTKQGAPVDVTIDDTYQRVAHALAEVESTPELREHWYERFLWALRRGAIPAGRITSNAG